MRLGEIYKSVSKKEPTKYCWLSPVWVIWLPRKLGEWLREREHISRIVLSQLCGLADGAIRKYERREAEPTVKSLVAIANHFNVSTDYLLGRTNY